MELSTIFNLAREWAGVTESNYPDTRLLPFLNAVKDDLFPYLITWVNEDYNWDVWRTASIENQSEYILPEAASDTEWNLKINWVSINYDWTTYEDWTLKYKKATEVKLSSLPEEWAYYANMQSKERPIYYVADKSIFLAPHPKADTAGLNRIQLKWIKSIPDYTDATTEAEIKLPVYLHQVLVQWILPYIHRSERRKDEASFEEKKYREDRDLAVKKFSSRVQAPYYLSLPSMDGNNDYEITSEQLN